jgi:hypothetical protein
VVWLLVTMGNIPRPQFIGIAQKGGNIDVLVQALSGVLNSRSLDLLLVVFSNFAVASSFLGVTLGLFDYLADLFGFDDSALGRFKTALLTFIPPMMGGLVKPMVSSTPSAMPAWRRRSGRRLYRRCWLAHRVNASAAHSSALGRKADDCADPAVWPRQRGCAFPVEL